MSRPSNGATFDRLNPVTGEVASRAAAAPIADAKRAADAAAAAFPAWSATGPNARRAILLKAADLLASKAPQFIELMAAETGATAGWAGFNVHLAAGMLREAASMTTQITGEVIPSDKPGCIAMAIRQPVGVVLGIAPWNAPVILGVRAIAHAARLRQHRGAEGLGESARAPIALIAECLRDAGLPPGVRQRRHQRAGGCAGALVETLIAHPGRAPGQFHRLDPGRPHHRADRGQVSQAGAARTRRQGAADRARRRRYRRGGQRRGLRRLHQPGPDLHVDRAHRRRREDRRRLRRPSSRPRPDRWSPAIRARATRRSAR